MKDLPKIKVWLIEKDCLALCRDINVKIFVVTMNSYYALQSNAYNELTDGNHEE
tara:strand:- start:234 stop:395 length:162 start_codon:yes stop_codon:yes gene_type:complete